MYIPPVIDWTKRPEIFHVTTDAQVKAYVHPVRMQILGLLQPAPATISQVAEILGVHPANITHHFRTLEQNGLIALVEERDSGRYIEKFYATVAENYTIAPPPGTVKNPGRVVLEFLRDDLTAAAEEIVDDDRRFIFGLIRSVPVPRERLAEFATKLRAVFEEFTEAAVEGEASATINVSVYPTSRAPRLRPAINLRARAP